MKRYRLCLRLTGEFEDVEAPSAEEACRMVGWLIGDTWVREETRGQYANGWRNITTREPPISWEQVEGTRAAMPPRPPTGSLGSGVWDEANGKFEKATEAYKRAHGVSWFDRPDWDYSLHKVKV